MKRSYLWPLFLPLRGKWMTVAAWFSFYFPGWLRVVGPYESKCRSRSQEMGKDGEQELKPLYHKGYRQGKDQKGLTWLQLGTQGGVSAAPQAFFFFWGQFLEGLIIKTGVLQLPSALLLQWQCVNMNEVKDLAGGGRGQQHGEVKGVMERRICVDWNCSTNRR